ncbi:MAG TPA: hypothetical protein VF623_06230, partial [Segetibacter sp.]
NSLNSNKSPIKNLGAKLILSFLLILTASGTQAQQPLSVIANQKGSPAALSSNEMKSVFRGEKQRWNNGTKVVIALLKTNNPVGLSICKKIYDMKPDELNKYWLALVFQGKASAPFFFNSIPELQAFVSQNSGAIGIIDEPANTGDIKTVTVDGKKTI